MVSVQETQLTVTDIDALDESPLLDINPYSRQFDVAEMTDDES